MPSNSPTDPAPPRRRWRRPFAILLFACACVATLVVAFFLVEKVRGRAEWRAYEAEAKARGVKMMLMDYAPPPVPDADNFAAIPLFEETFRAAAEGKPIPNPLALPQDEKVKPPPFNNLAKQQRIDLGAWQAYFVETKLLDAAGGDAAADVLAALRKYDAPLAQLREAGARPKCRFPVRYEDGMTAALPHLQVVQSAAKIYALRMAAHLAAAQRAEALEDFRGGLRLHAALRDEPTLMSTLVGVSILSILENAVWGGLAAGQWGDAELREIETALAPLRLFAHYLLGMGSERGFANQTYASFQNQSSRELAKMLALSEGLGGSGGRSTSAVLAISLYPRGWFHRSQVRSNEYIDEMLARVTVDPPRLDTSNPIRSSHKPQSTYDRLRHMLFYLFAPALEHMERRFAASQTYTDQTRLACALERHRLARGGYPATLDALVPEFIASVPRDVMTGEPLRYRLEGSAEVAEGTRGGRVDGRESLPGGTARSGTDGAVPSSSSFVLYSVAMNGEDDGGQIGDKSSVTDHLDWVWRYPGK